MSPSRVTPPPPSCCCCCCCWLLDTLLVHLAQRSVQQSISRVGRVEASRGQDAQLELELLMNLASPGQAGGTLFRSNPLQAPSASPSANVAAFNQREVAVIDAAHFKADRWTEQTDGEQGKGAAGGAGTFNLLKNL